MQVTVCEFSDAPERLRHEWAALVTHVRRESSDLVLLPEMPFAPWFAAARPFSDAVWAAAVRAHEEWLARLPELAPAAVCGTRPVERHGRRLNEGFLWTDPGGYEPVHHKYYLPDEEDFWEASWYARGAGDFAPCDIGGIRAGMLICTELWFGERARAYGREGATLLLCPRATPGSSRDKWLAGGRTAAVVAGAYCLSSNRGGTDERGLSWSGTGWIIDPEEGDVLALTSRERPFVTLALDPQRAAAAKSTYPRYVAE
ncbi:MAG: carbon-nitrogen hydrolase family protein [Acidobacteria bacterium]|nr:carbon-nitrogen hydrolase family protein [Acidobacteriota bacterium]